MLSHELKSSLQKHFTDGLVTIVGSGLSVAEGLPSMTDLSEHLKASIAKEICADDQRLWDDLSRLIDAKGLEAALLEQPVGPAVERAIIKLTAEFIANKERDVIAKVFSGMKTLRFTLLLRHLLKPSTGVQVVTTNYDRLIEVASEEAGLGADTLFVGQFAGHFNENESKLSFCRDVKLNRTKKSGGNFAKFVFRDRVNVFKPHGSLDWYERNGKPVRYGGQLPLTPLIITPGQKKFRAGYESPFDRHRERANAAIDAASRFLILGYGFNDDHLETHLTPKIRNGTPTILLTHKISDNALRIARDCPNLIAIQNWSDGDRVGSSVFKDKIETIIPDVSLWDLGSFIREVLEP